ncbi:hypothetical protein COV12_01085 [Candidatus Woesearchaeota archaeon CG10_big_fil_rev_8_21_14_0_10_32_24]|nr:MAG: hypothetical protein COV12_01085 [Candidatus Woesearchaeota archaeon CG10_big_fil_rev_8_21_14_0_10_32_24]
MHYGGFMMKEDKNPKSHVSWCFKQKRGIKLEEPNDNLCNVYIKKAKSSLNMLESATEKDEIDWISTTAYYARYFAFYALLQKCGIKSEIHDCTISLMSFLFVEDNLVEEHFYNELQLAKELRVDTQYYVTEDIDLEKLKKDSETARNFVLKMEEVIENLIEEQIKIIRKKLNNARP